MVKDKKGGLNIMAEDIERVTKGVLTGDSGLTVDEISTDSRTIKAGELFVAIKGENYDGHEYVSEALKKGACGAVVEKGFKMTGNMNNKSFFIEVDDSLKAYQDVAAYNRGRSDAKVVAITGSSGKTTTKEMIRSILAAKKEAYIVSEKNFNNFIGIPMTLLKVRDNHKIVVLEVGINQLDEMDRLASITNPDIALVTNAGSSHLEFLKNVDTVANEKMKLADGLKDGGTLIFNYDDLRLLMLSRKKGVDTLSYGFSKFADIVGENFTDISLNKSKLTVKMDDGKNVTLNLQVNGEHNAYNVLAAIATARALKLPANAIIKGIEAFQPKDMRCENIILNNDIVILNDAYNSNPESIKAALNLFKSLKGAKRKIAVLGDMLELGAYSKRAHKEVGAIVANFGFDDVYFLGNEMKNAAKNAGYSGMDKSRIHWFDALDALFEDLCPYIEDGDWIMLKGSRLNKLEVIAEKLIEKIGVKDKLISR